MNPRRTLVNMISFLLISGGLLYVGITQYLFPPEPGQTISVTLADASGLLPRSDVTVRGVPSGSIQTVDLTDDGTALVTVALNPGVEVTKGTVAEVTRRSPIGDITMNLIPGQGAPLEDGGHIPIRDTVTPPDPVRTIEVLRDVLAALTPEDVGVVVKELATAVRGRSQDLATLAVAGADLPERILRVRTELESLIRTGPEVLDVLAANAETLADDITLTALLADILRDRRFDLLALTENGAAFAEVFGGLIAAEKANLDCLISDFGTVNAVLARPGNLENLEAVLDLNHFFFDGVDEANRDGKDGFGWFRVHFLPPQEPEGTPYNPDRPPPDVFGGNACRSPYGRGVGPARQPADPYISHGSKLHLGK